MKNMQLYKLYIIFQPQRTTNLNTALIKEANLVNFNSLLETEKINY